MKITTINTTATDQLNASSNVTAEVVCGPANLPLLREWCENNRALLSVYPFSNVREVYLAGSDVPALQDFMVTNAEATVTFREYQPNNGGTPVWMPEGEAHNIDGGAVPTGRAATQPVSIVDHSLCGPC